MFNSSTQDSMTFILHSSRQALRKACIEMLLIQLKFLHLNDACPLLCLVTSFLVDAQENFMTISLELFTKLFFQIELLINQDFTTALYGYYWSFCTLDYTSVLQSIFHQTCCQHGFLFSFISCHCKERLIEDFIFSSMVSHMELSIINPFGSFQKRSLWKRRNNSSILLPFFTHYFSLMRYLSYLCHL